MRAGTFKVHTSQNLLYKKQKNINISINVTTHILQSKSLKFKYFCKTNMYGASTFTFQKGLKLL